MHGMGWNPRDKDSWYLTRVLGMGKLRKDMVEAVAMAIFGDARDLTFSNGPRHHFQVVDLKLPSMIVVALAPVSSTSVHLQVPTSISQNVVNIFFQYTASWHQSCCKVSEIEAFPSQP